MPVTLPAGLYQRLAAGVPGDTTPCVQNLATYARYPLVDLVDPPATFVRAQDTTNAAAWTKPTAATNLAPLLALKAAGKLRLIDGDYVHSSTAAETILDNVEVTGQIRATTGAGRLVVRNAIVRVGAVTTGTTRYGVVSSFNSSIGIVCINVAIIPTIRTVDTYGFSGRHIELYGCYVEGCVDGASVYASPGGTTVVEDCYFVAGEYFTTDPRQTDGSHNDSIQFDGAGSGRIRNNNADGFHNAGVQVTQNQGRIEGLVIDGNRFGGGRLAVINLSDKGKGYIGSATGVKIRRNRFYRTNFSGRAALIEATTQNSSLYEWSNNVWDNDGAPIAAAANGGTGS